MRKKSLSLSLQQAYRKKETFKPEAKDALQRAAIAVAHGNINGWCMIFLNTLSVYAEINFQQLPY